MRKILTTIVAILITGLASFGVAHALGGGSLGPDKGTNYLTRINSTSIGFLNTSTSFGTASNRIKAVYGDTGDFNTALFSNIDNSGCGTFSGSATSTICGDGSVSTIGANLDVEGDLSVSNTLFTDINDQRVGIGTSSPSVPLEVVGADAANNYGAIFKTPDNDNQIVRVEAGEDKNAVFSLANQSGANWNFGLDGISSPSRFLVFDAANGNFPFSIETGADNNRFYAHENGNVGIGTDSPTSLLTVAGNSNIDGNLAVNKTNPNTALDVNGKGSFNDDHTQYGSMSTSSNATATTINTQNVYEEINVFGIGLTRGFTFSSSNLTATVTGTYKVDFDTTLQASNNNDIFELAIFVNGSEQQRGTCKTAAPNTGFDNCSNHSLVQLNSGDVVDLRVRNTSGADNVTVQEANFVITQQ